MVEAIRTIEMPINKAPALEGLKNFAIRIFARRCDALPETLEIRMLIMSNNLYFIGTYLTFMDFVGYGKF